MITRIQTWSAVMAMGVGGAAALMALSGMQVPARAAEVAAAAQVFVSPGGDDANPGTADRPVLTLARARDLVRSHLAGMSGDAVVTLAAGEYRLAEPLVLSEADSGTGGHDVVYTAADGARVVISGGVKVDGWKQVDAGKNLWAAPAPPSLSNTRQLYVNGVRALRAAGRLPVHLTQTETGYTADSDVMSHWRNPADIEFVYTGGNALWSEPSEGLGAWTEPRIPVASIEGTTITMAQPCWDNSTKRVDLPKSFHSTRSANLVGPGHVGKQPVSVENAFELLGTPGQWYLDRSAKTIYYVPRAGEDLANADVEAPLLEKLIDGQGTAEHPVHNIRFRGLQFSYATWLFPSSPEGFSEIQANFMVTGKDGYAVQGLGDLAPGGKQPFGDWTPTPGNVAFVYDRNIGFDGCVFTHLGAAGLSLGEGSQNDSVRGCVFTDISGNGLALGAVNQPEARQDAITRDDMIANNHFFDVPAEYHGGVGIDVGYVQHVSIVHNQLDHLPYTGISIGWGGWPDKIERPGVANNSADNLIANNLVFDHLLLLADGGGIYTQGLTGPNLAHGEHVTGNVVHDQYGSGHAIYSDNGSANMVITGNAMFDDNFDNWGTAHANYYNDLKGKTRDWFDIENNYWQQGTPDSEKENVTLKNNHLIANGREVPTEVIASAGLEPAYQHLLTEAVDGAARPPAAPARVSAFAADGCAYVAFSPPTCEGSEAVDHYTVTASTGQSATISAKDFDSAAYVTVPNLSNGAACTFSVTASNSVGTSPPSMPSLAVTPTASPASPPEAPKIGAVYGSDGKLVVHFSPPANDGGRPVIAYRITAQPGNKSVELRGRIAITLSGRHSTFAVVDGLSNGTEYTATVTAITPGGESTSEPGKAVMMR